MNKTISVYDLLGLIKDGKAPKKIMYNDNVYEFNEYDYRCIVTEIERGFVDHRLIKNYNQNLQSSLNEKVEIIEEDKKIEKLKIKDGKITGNWGNGNYYCYTLSSPQAVIVNKLNELVDEVNKLKENE